MKTAILAIVFALLALSFIEVPGNAQNRSRRSRPRPPSNVTNNIELMDAGTIKERARIAEECAVPGKPKPAVEVGMNGNALLCGKAISLPRPTYPAEGKAEKASGAVHVNVVIDEKGRVIWAEANVGHLLLRGPAVKAACQSRFEPVKISGRAVKAGGIITYNFLLE